MAAELLSSVAVRNFRTSSCKQTAANSKCMVRNMKGQQHDSRAEHLQLFDEQLALRVLVDQILEFRVLLSSVNPMFCETDGGCSHCSVESRGLTCDIATRARSVFRLTSAPHVVRDFHMACSGFGLA